MDEKVNLASKLALLDAPYEPGIVGFLNDYKLQVVKVKGPFVWHKHDETDDFFLVLSGRLIIHLRDRDIELDAGELFVVPRGVEHCPDAQEETEVLLIEPRDTINTGDAVARLSAAGRVRFDQSEVAPAVSGLVRKGVGLHFAASPTPISGFQTRQWKLVPDG